MKVKYYLSQLILFVIGLNPIFAQFSPNSFATKVDFSAASNVQGINHGDLNNDGKQDIISANIGSNSLTIYVNASSNNSINTGSFSSFNLTTLNAQPQQVAVGDLNNDGKLDLVVGYSTTSGSQFSVFVNNYSSGTMSSASFSRQDFTAGSAPAGIAIGDFDRDGKNDIVVTAYGGSSIYVFRNTTTGISITLATASLYTVGTAPSAVAVGDLDRDNKPDIVVSNYSSNSITIFRNTNIVAGAFSFSTQTIATATAPYWLRLSDYTNDGLLDISVSCYFGPSVSIFRNTSVGTSITMATRFDVSVSPNSATQANFSSDMDGDGTRDLAVAVAVSTPPSVMVYKNVFSSGTFNASSFSSSSSYTVGGGPVGLISVDLDNDMRPDLVAGSYTNSYISILKNQNLATEPTVSSSNLSSTFSGGVLTLNLNKGNGSKRMVVCRLVASGQTTPNDTNVYLANDTFGLGQNLGSGNFVVYADTGRVVQIKGLSVSNAYVISVYEFNGYGGFTNYFQSGVSNLNFSLNNFFYSKSSGNVDLTSSWGSNVDGSGTPPSSFNLPSTTYVLSNNTSPTIGANWIVTGAGSYIQIGDGTNALNFIVPAGMSVFTDSIAVRSNATLTFLGGLVTNKSYFDSLSTVQFISTSAQNIPGNSYYNLVAAGGTKTLMNQTFVRGSLNMLTHIQTGSFTLTLGTSPSFPGTLNRSNGTIIGKFARFYGPNTNTGSSALFPIGTASFYRPAKVEYTTAPTAGGLVTAEFISSNPGNSGLPLYDFSAFPLIEINKAANSGFWRITSSGLTGGVYTLTLNGAGFLGIATVADLRILKRQVSGAWVTQGTAVPGTGTPANPEVSRTGLSGLGEFTYGGDSSVNPLPVEWLHFEAKRMGGVAVLSWATGSENNNQGFDIERKELGAASFEKIGWLAGTNQNKLSQYRFEDLEANPNQGFVYRVKQTDFDGKFSYTPEEIIRPIANEMEIVLYPNPARNELYVLSETPLIPGTYRALSMDGKSIELLLNGNFFDVSGLDNGIYFIIDPHNKPLTRFLKN